MLAECLVQVGVNDGEDYAVPPASPSRMGACGTMAARCVQTDPSPAPSTVACGSLSGGVPMKLSSQATGDSPSSGDPVKLSSPATGNSPSGDVPVRPTALEIDDFLPSGALVTIGLFG